MDCLIFLVLLFGHLGIVCQRHRYRDGRTHHLQTRENRTECPSKSGLRTSSAVTRLVAAVSSIHSTDGLAIFGGKPAFSEPLHVGRPNQGDRERLFARLGEMLDRNWLSNNGPFVQELEQSIAEHVGVRHCVAMCNATVALEIAIRALELSGEVIVPSMTFVATAHALQWQQITPVFCDIDPHTHTLDPESGRRTDYPAHQRHHRRSPLGPALRRRIARRDCRPRGLALLFDAAHAFSCSHRGRMIGGFGAAEVFSFHATKFFNTLEGGAVVTNDDQLARKIRLMKNFGFAGYDNVTYIGTNGKMTEASAALGLTSLESLEEIRAVNRRNHRLYCDVLRDVPGISVAVVRRAGI